MESFISVADSQYKQDFMRILYNAIELLRVNIAKVYGEKNISFMVSKFVQAASGTMPKLNHGRILAEEPDLGIKLNAENSDDTAHSIQVIFGVVFMFLILYVCVYLYRMEVYKDSLIYSRFITSKKDKKN